MKKTVVFFTAVWMCVLMLTGCEGYGQPSADGDLTGDTVEGSMGVNSPGDTMEEDSPEDTMGNPQGDFQKNSVAAEPGGDGADNGSSESDAIVLTLCIVDGAESGNLVLAGEDSVYTLSVQNGEIPIYLDGQSADYSALEDGMTVEIRFDYIMETFPGQIGQVHRISAYSLGTEQNPGGGCYDLCGLYLQVLNDLWDKDEGLNGNINYVSVDLSDAPGGLTEGEKEAVAWIFACQHNAQWLTMTYEELAQQGYLAEVEGVEGSGLYQWKNGILFTITACEQEEGVFSLPQIRFNAAKWRSPLGAYYFIDCSAIWPQMGTWEEYKIGGEAIS